MVCYQVVYIFSEEFLYPLQEMEKMAKYYHISTFLQ